MGRWDFPFSGDAGDAGDGALLSNLSAWGYTTCSVVYPNRLKKRDPMGVDLTRGRWALFQVKDLGAGGGKRRGGSFVQVDHWWRVVVLRV